MSKYKIIQVVESEAILNNTVFDPYTIITFYNDSNKFKIGDGKTAFNSLSEFGGEGITSDTQTALDTKLTASKVASQATSTATTLADLVTDFNDLIAAMKTAGVMET